MEILWLAKKSLKRISKASQVANTISMVVAQLPAIKITPLGVRTQEAALNQWSKLSNMLEFTTDIHITTTQDQLRMCQKHLARLDLETRSISFIQAAKSTRCRAATCRIKDESLPCRVTIIRSLSFCHQLQTL